jgi:Tol biopolymer transport system component
MTSANGESWVRVPSGPEFRVARPADPQNARGAAMSQVVAWGSRFAALGEHDGDPTVWVTAGGQEEEKGDVTTRTLPTPGPVVSNALAYGVDGDIFLAAEDGANAVKIADGDPDDGFSGCAPGEVRSEYTSSGTVWSPDGRYLAYWDWRPCPAAVPDEWGTVIITDAEGNVVASFPGEGWAISWSPDSTRVAVMDNWSVDDPEGAIVGVYGVDGTHQAAIPVTSGSLSGDYSPVWSRDGTSILLPGVQVPLDGDAPTWLPADRGVVYSPDGSHVARVENGTLIVDDAAGSDATKAADPGELRNAAWSPNGDLVAFEAKSGTRLLVRNVATGADTLLVDVKRSENVQVIEFSPDGNRLLFTRSDAGDATSLWSIGADGSDLRLLVDGIEWADLRPHGRPS